MRIRETRLQGLLVVDAEPIRDERGDFYEAMRCSAIEDVLQRPFRPAQSNYSRSAAGVVRGLHGVTIPPGQAKLVTCHQGAVRDFVVDVRVGSPTFGEWVGTELDALSGRAVFVAEGLAHGFVALVDGTCVGYQCSTEHVPGTQLDLDPFDPQLALPWDPPGGVPIASAKDAAAPTIEQAAAAGMLPDHAAALRAWM